MAAAQGAWLVPLGPCAPGHPQALPKCLSQSQRLTGNRVTTEGIKVTSEEGNSSPCHKS